MPSSKSVADKQRNAVKILRVVARVFGGIIVILFLTIPFTEGIQQALTVESLFIMIPIAVAVAAYIVAWWRELLGGILMLTAYLLLGISPSVHSIFYREALQFYTGIFIYGSPFLVLGIMYIVTYWLNRHYGKGKARLEGDKVAG